MPKMTIWRFPLRPEEHVEDKVLRVKMPSNADILTVQTKDGEPNIWAIVNPKEPREMRTFLAVPTGDEITKPSNLTYIGTFQTQEPGYFGPVTLVFHLFEVLDK